MIFKNIYFEWIAPLQTGVLAIVSLTIKDIDVIMSIITKIVTIMSAGVIISYHLMKIKRIKKLLKNENNKENTDVD